jgi:uncharacterized protein YprB with RNaseH-like and TPR domain
MLDESLRLRLETLNRSPLPATGAPPRASSAVRMSTLRSKASVRSPLRPGTVMPIPGLVRLGEVVNTDAGTHWRVCIPVEQLWPGGERLVAKRHETLAANGETKCEFIPAFPHRTLFIDLETCGLSGSALFLVGLLRPIDGRLTVELLLARNYAEEVAVLTSLWQRIEPDSVLVTFNGKSFDWPMVVDRSRRYLMFRGTPLPALKQHDVLHLARRRWKGDLPDCKLQTLEERICGRLRVGDIPSKLIPAAYHTYVKTGFERELDQILFHNALDLVTVLDLSMRLGG